MRGDWTLTFRSPPSSPIYRERATLSISLDLPTMHRLLNSSSRRPFLLRSLGTRLKVTTLKKSWWIPNTLWAMDTEKANTSPREWALPHLRHKISRWYDWIFSDSRPKWIAINLLQNWTDIRRPSERCLGNYRLGTDSRQIESQVECPSNSRRCRLLCYVDILILNLLYCIRSRLGCHHTLCRKPFSTWRGQPNLQLHLTSCIHDQSHGTLWSLPSTRQSSKKGSRLPICLLSISRPGSPSWRIMQKTLLQKLFTIS